MASETAYEDALARREAAATPYEKAVVEVELWELEGDNPTFLEFQVVGLDRLPPFPFRVTSVKVNHGALKDYVFPAQVTRILLHNTTTENVMWPPYLQDLNISSVDHADLTTVPECLNSLRLSFVGSITGFAPKAPLEHLSVQSCPWFTKLPALPASLLSLYVVKCGLKKLPRAFPPALQALDLKENRIRRLPAFPATLTYLSTTGNPLLLAQEPTDTYGSANEGPGLRAYLHSLYRLQEHPEEIPFDNDMGLSPDESADPYGLECWEGDI